MTDNTGRQLTATEFIKKPIVIEAFRMGIDPRPDWFQDKVTANEITTFVVEKNKNDGTGNPFEFNKTGCVITTLEGDMIGGYGDYIIKGVKGEVYPCKPDIFELTYSKTASPSLPSCEITEVNKICKSFDFYHWLKYAKIDMHKTTLHEALVEYGHYFTETQPLPSVTKRAEEILKYKQNSLNHLLHFPSYGSSQLQGTYIHISTVYEAMNDFASQSKQQESKEASERDKQEGEKE